MVRSSSSRPARVLLAVGVVAAAGLGLAPVAADATTGATPAPACSPAIRDLGDPLGGGFSFADGVNAAGTIVGSAALPDGLGRAVVWQGGKVTNLGVVPPYDESFAHGVNDAGTVVGELNFKQTKAAPFIYSHGSMRRLPGLGGDFGYASAVNNRGVVVGTASDAKGRAHAVVWTDDGRTVHDLGIAPGDRESYGSGINDANVVAGDTDTAAGDERPALFDHGTVVVLLGSKGRLGAAEDINESGRAVGITFRPDGTEQATSWDPFQSRGHGITGLPGGTFASLVDVDDHGRAAGGGNGGGPDLDVTHAVVWPGYGPLLALRPLSGRFAGDFAVARQIGTKGQAVGGSQAASGEIHATVWTCAFQQAFRPHQQQTAASRAAATSVGGAARLVPPQLRTVGARTR